jgi:hypothetical protein
VAYVLSTFSMPNSCAVMATDFIVTTGKCVQLFYQWLYSGTLNVYLVDEDGKAELVKSVSMSLQANYTSLLSVKWSVLVVSLPASDYLKQVVIKVTRSPYGQSGVIIDDFNVRPCSDLS